MTISTYNQSVAYLNPQLQVFCTNTPFSNLPVNPLLIPPKVPDNKNNNTDSKNNDQEIDIE
ncbi:hypothetical protein H1R20_g13128, partial [Candolleomyces eurysporus]